MISTAGQPFHDPAADSALVEALRAYLDPTIDARYVETHINDPAFAVEMAETLHAHYQAAEVTA
jgi:uncharacterized protein (UPF0261 family)